jgi:hypothetical protein
LFPLRQAGSQIRIPASARKDSNTTRQTNLTLRPHGPRVQKHVRRPLRPRLHERHFLVRGSSGHCADCKGRLGTQRPTNGRRPGGHDKEFSVDRNTATDTQTLKWGREGRKAKGNDQKPRKPTESQGPCPDLRGTCIKALTVQRRSRPQDRHFRSTTLPKALGGSLLGARTIWS